MPTTSIKLTVDLKARVAAAAASTGKSAHAFMVEAIERQTRAAELRAEFLEDAYDARGELDRTSTGYAAEAVHAYLDDRVQGRDPERPKPTSWRD